MDGGIGFGDGEKSGTHLLDIWHHVFILIWAIKAETRSGLLE